MASSRPDAAPSALQDANGATSVPDRGVPKAKAEATKVSYMSLPHKGQLAILCMARLAEPLATTSIQSYMFYQLKSFDPNASAATIAAQAGFIIGAQRAAQVCTGMLWGRLADSEFGGRKTVLVLGLLSSAIACLGYGFSRSFVSAVAWQIFGGAMNNNIAIVRCVVAELNPEKRYRTRALLLLPLCANSGMLIGPLVGGLLSGANGKGSLEAFPYAPPNLLVAAVFVVAALGVILGLRETLEALQHGKHSFTKRVWNKVVARLRGENSMEYQYEAILESEPMLPLTPTTPNGHVPRGTESEAPKRKARLTFWRIWTFNVCCTMLAHFIIAGHLAIFSSLWAIFLQAPIGSSSDTHLPFRFTGGLGMRPRDVGFALSLLGAIGVVLQAAVYPLLNDRYGTITTWRVALFVFPVVYLLAPYPSLVASSMASPNDDNVGTQLGVWLAMSLVQLLFTLGRTGVTPATTLLINDCTPHPSVRGTIHTGGVVLGNLGRSLFPVVALAIFGRGLEIDVVGLAFWCVAGLAVLACVASRWVTEGQNGKEIKLDGDEEMEAPSSEAPAASR
ncbi:major facilitator superfamily domain-containing protein [Mycena rebaudengoi]|nr:major facilitator superfamily domain-containing protein [Mycena rebaudengoi]